MLKSFDDLIRLLGKSEDKECKTKLGIVEAKDEHSIESALRAEKMGLVEPIFIGETKGIVLLLEKFKAAKNYKIVNTNSPEESARIAVKMANEGEIDAIMKGKIDSGTYLKAIVNIEKGLGTGRLMTHVVLNEIPTYPKLVCTTDGGMVMYPNIEEKKQIIENSVEVFHKLGYKKPKVGCLCAVEKVNPKMPETVEADQLKKWNEEGLIKDCIVEGPISLDLALSKSIAVAKEYDSLVAGDVDILNVPNITSGNILGKSLTVAAGGIMAGIIYGAKVPIIMTSRGSTMEEKVNSIAFASAINVSKGDKANNE